VNDQPAKRGGFFSAFRRVFGREEQPAPAREEEIRSVEEVQSSESGPPLPPVETRTVDVEAVEVRLAETPHAGEAQAVEVEAVEEAAPPASPPPRSELQRLSWLQRLRRGLAKTSTQLAQNIAGVFTRRKLDAETLQELEDLLIQADLGVETSARIADALAKGRHDKEITTEEVRAVLAAEVQRVLAPVAKPLLIPRGEGVQVVLVVGVNGTGKTTTIGKLAHSLIGQGSSVMIAAGDTFRAAAIDQLKIWGERTGAEVIARNVGADAAGLAFDALMRAREKDCDVLLIDTAGRLQNKQALMDELEKVIRVLRKIDPTAPHHVLLVLDATTGQNALNQVEVFKDKAGVTGLIMTKLDGTARGGILVAISAKFGLPVHAIGVGEAVEDLSEFDAAEFARAIALG
jgi:fused signal recognition particle receptor